MRWPAVAGAVVVALLLLVLLPRLLRSREDRLRDFLVAEREALLEGEDAAFFAGIDPAVKYQSAGGMAEVRRDHAKFRSAGVGRVTFTKEQVKLDEAGADVTLEALLSAGLRPIASVSVQIRLQEDDGAWRATSISWR